MSIDENMFRKLWLKYGWENKVTINCGKASSFKEMVSLIAELNLTLTIPEAADEIDEALFFVGNFYSKSQLGEDALVNFSLEKVRGRIVGTCLIRSDKKDFTKFVGERIKKLIN